MSKKNKKQKLSNTGVLATNRKARHDYTILDTWECGIVLQGTEIKALREGKVSLVEAFATIDNGEVWLRNMHIPEYSKGHWTNHPPRRTRKLLLHRREIDSLEGKVRDGNRTLIPLSLYLKDGRAKVELGLGQGKQDYDKRRAIKRRTEDREITRELGRKLKGIKA
ncbi:SsrA-binding protein [Corynebacterium sp. HMSC08F01]|uniref:SsrA-binding protein n=1 Tax=Corynebacterium coyleae TaxID=53374 RepID=A0AAP6XLL5_9CORY|nr:MULTISPECIES: SsrA-binding protein SmpB [Corynebacterium]MDK8800503.1 SsrA-binding protein SmpB [Corynebacterium coyleae]NJJ04795.1 SsrA-binding protein SmpB [Corynebacterium coyleae]OFL13583.1 SsrA-binding protein [Corynebacterium sp. HMSC067D03]OFL91065.1 SsrA-binding protein [Corynebacterium sp. HMSC055D05]OFO34748.1 SsrA-binding protein [Corynebacterium sp. HMSC075D04]